MSGILNLPGLRELDKKESETEYHVKAEPAAIARRCPHCGELFKITFGHLGHVPRPTHNYLLLRIAWTFDRLRPRRNSRLVAATD